MRLRPALFAFTLLVAPAAACAPMPPAAAVAPAAPIDRQALVQRHNVTLTAIDRHAPIQLGNGDLGFTADITGLQTFPEQYSELAPLMTMAQWAWHSFPNPEGYTEEDGLVNVPVPGRGEQPYAWMKSWDVAETNPAYTWLRANPHRFSLSRIGLTFADGISAPGKYVELKAEQDVIVLISNCPQLNNPCNGWNPTPAEVLVWN